MFHERALIDEAKTALVNDAYIFGESLPIVALIYGMFFILLITIGKVLYRIGKGFAIVVKIFLSVLLYVCAFTLEKADYLVLTLVVFSIFIGITYWVLLDIL